MGLHGRAQCFESLPEQTTNVVMSRSFCPEFVVWAWRLLGKVDCEGMQASRARIDGVFRGCSRMYGGK